MQRGAGAAVSHRGDGRLHHRRAARLSVQALRQPRHPARRVHGHSRSGRAHHWRVRPGQERAGAGSHHAGSRPGGRRLRGPAARGAEHHRGPLSAAVAEPAGSARHRSARYQDHFWRDCGAPQNAAKAHLSPDSPRCARPQLRPSARRQSGRRCAGCADSKGDDPGGSRTQPRRAGRISRAQHHSATSGYRHPERISGTPAPSHARWGRLKGD